MEKYKRNKLINIIVSIILGLLCLFVIVTGRSNNTWLLIIIALIIPLKIFIYKTRRCPVCNKNLATIYVKKCPHCGADLQ